MVTDQPDYEQFFQQAPCGYLLLDDDGTIRMINDTFLHWTGHRREALLGTPLQRLLPMGDRLLFSTHCIPQLRLSGAVSEVSLEVLDAEGVRKAALLTAVRSSDADDHGSVRVIVFSAHERRKYELELVAARRRAEESEARSVKAEAGLQHLALHDTLTGLPNRAGLAATLESALTGGGTPDRELAVLFLDLDRFKAVNDSLGHGAGDELLTIVARRLRATVRASSTVARFAGDEFVILEQVSGVEEAGHLADRILQVINATMVIEGLEVVCSASIGVALTNRQYTTVDRLLRGADIAMYQAKARGRNTWAVHDPTEVDPAANRMHLLGELRTAIATEQLRLHYQPRVDLHTGRINSVEALVRWQHPTRGLLQPADFIDLAEESGLIRSLGAWVLEEAVSQSARWRNLSPEQKPVEIAVNLSTRQLLDPDLLGIVSGTLTRHAFDPRQLTLEITETALMEDPVTALQVLTALKELGVCLAIDDFGTGYASLTYLKHFPIDELKIDRSFIQGLGDDDGDSAIVSSCIQLAHAVGIRAVAEGVETPDQQSTLLDLGCDMAQGFHYSRPLAPEALASWVSTHLLSTPDGSAAGSPPLSGDVVDALIDDLQTTIGNRAVKD
jgi:diguanylate cyclase (GGDEF)-like protein/PAS domain S-box-containing protein